jgi:hypothetical protein
VASANSGYTLRLLEDQLASRRLVLPALNRLLYARRGALVVATPAGQTRVPESQAWHGADACEVGADDGDATALRWELARGAGPRAGEHGGVSTTLLDHPIDLVPGAAYLMRADLVEFALGGVALPHRHRGGGIRCLLGGSLDVTVGDAPARRVTPGGAWFESGREPVLAVASKDEPTSFVRVAILPREIRGRTSIMYVDPADAERGRPRTYTVYVDEPIDIG